MDKKLEQYRKTKRRQAILNSYKEKFWNMVSFHQVAKNEKSDHVIIETEIENKTDRDNSDTESILSSSTLAEDDYSSDDAPSLSDDSKCFKYFTYTVYFLFWATCYAIAIQLKFGVVYLMFSALIGIYLNTRTGPKPKNEISAYSVFNENCEAIDGTLKGEQFEREIRYGALNMK